LCHYLHLALGDKHEYIAIIGNVLYRGYTPLTQDEKENNTRAKPFVEYKDRKKFENYLAHKYNETQQQF